MNALDWFFVQLLILYVLVKYGKPVEDGRCTSIDPDEAPSSLLVAETGGKRCGGQILAAFSRPWLPSN